MWKIVCRVGEKAANELWKEKRQSASEVVGGEFSETTQRIPRYRGLKKSRPACAVEVFHEFTTLITTTSLSNFLIPVERLVEVLCGC